MYWLCVVWFMIGEFTLPQGRRRGKRWRVAFYRKEKTSLLAPQARLAFWNKFLCSISPDNNVKCPAGFQVV